MKDWPRHYILCQLLVGLLGHNQWNNEGSNECRKRWLFFYFFLFFLSILEWSRKQTKKGTAYIMYRDVGAGSAGGMHAPPPRFFFRSVNPIYQPGTYYTPHITASPSPKIFRPSDISGTYVMRLGTSVMISLLMQLRLVQNRLNIKKL